MLCFMSFVTFLSFQMSKQISDMYFLISCEIRIAQFLLMIIISNLDDRFTKYCNFKVFNFKL